MLKIFSIFFSIIFTVPALKKDFDVTLTHSLKKIFPEKRYFKEEIRDSIQLSAARNEHEGFQIVIVANRELKDVKIEIGDLINEESKIIKKENISLYKVGFVKTKRPYYNTLRVGLWPDPLIPLRGTFQIEKDTVQPIWVDIYVPEDTPKGNYKGKVILKTFGSQKEELEIKLKVWDFTLPKESHLKTGFDFYEYLVDWRYPKFSDESDSEYQKRLEDLKRTYYLNMLTHRINPIHNVGNPQFLGKKDGRYILDFQKFDEKVEFYKKFGQTCFGIAQEWPWGYKGDWTDKWYGFRDSESVEGVFREYGRHLEEKGWLDLAYAYIFDETFHRVEEITSLIHRGHSGIKNLLTMTPQEGYPDIDIWCVRINNIEKKNVEEFRKRGKEIWMYVAGHTSPYPSLNLDLASIEYRVIPWICWKYNIEGLLYWCVNWWHTHNPWQDPETFPQQNGNGYLYYPDPQGRGAVGSIRLEVLRDGLEDYEYLYILKEKLKEIKNSPKAKEGSIKKIETLLKIPEDLINSPASHTNDTDKLYTFREEIASLIEENDGI